MPQISGSLSRQLKDGLLISHRGWRILLGYALLTSSLQRMLSSMLLRDLLELGRKLQQTRPRGGDYAAAAFTEGGVATKKKGFEAGNSKLPRLMNRLYIQRGKGGNKQGGEKNTDTHPSN